MAALAALDAIKSADIDPVEIEMIIVATTTPDMVFPLTACLVQGAIGAHKAAAMDISAACTGFLYALDMAVCYVKSSKYNKVLLIGADTYSRITNQSDLNTSVLFGDGAGAVILGCVPGRYRQPSWRGSGLWQAASRARGWRKGASHTQAA